MHKRARRETTTRQGRVPALEAGEHIGALEVDSESDNDVAMGLMLDSGALSFADSAGDRGQRLGDRPAVLALGDKERGAPETETDIKPEQKTVPPATGAQGSAVKNEPDLANQLRTNIEQFVGNMGKVKLKISMALHAAANDQKKAWVLDKLQGADLKADSLASYWQQILFETDLKHADLKALKTELAANTKECNDYLGIVRVADTPGVKK